MTSHTHTGQSTVWRGNCSKMHDKTYRCGTIDLLQVKKMTINLAVCAGKKIREVDTPNEIKTAVNWVEHKWCTSSAQVYVNRYREQTNQKDWMREEKNERTRKDWMNEQENDLSQGKKIHGEKSHWRSLVSLCNGYYNNNQK